MKMINQNKQVNKTKNKNKQIEATIWKTSDKRHNEKTYHKT